jgi:hypothetical protein
MKCHHPSDTLEFFEDVGDGVVGRVREKWGTNWTSIRGWCVRGLSACRVSILRTPFEYTHLAVKSPPDRRCEDFANCYKSVLNMVSIKRQCVETWTKS